MGPYLHPIALVDGQCLYSASRLHLHACAVDDLTGSHQVLEHEACLAALVQGDHVDLALHLHATDLRSGTKTGKCISQSLLLQDGVLQSSLQERQGDEAELLQACALQKCQSQGHAGKPPRPG